MTDYTQLDADVSKIRKANPNIAACFDDVEAILKQLAPPTPPTPPPVAKSWWLQDATAATVDPQSAAAVKAWAPLAGFGSGNFAATDAYATASASDPAYTIKAAAPSGQQALGGKTVRIPAGTQPGESHDAHLTVYQPDGTVLDLGNASFSGSAWSCYSGCLMTATAQQEPSPGNANAAHVPLMAGLITPMDIASGRIAHALVVSCGGLGPAPCPYPANTDVGYNGPTKITLGSRLRVNPAVALPSVPAGSFEAMIAVALQQFGFYPRDTSGSSAIFSIHGVDTINQTPVQQAYQAVGVKLSAPTSSNPAYVNLSSTLTTWIAANLQLLEPPTRIA